MADNTVEIRIIGKNEAGDTLAEVNGQLTTFKKEGDKASGSARELESKLNLAKQAFDAIAGAIMGAVEETINYSNSVQDAARMLGVSVEEASALINIADDVRVSVGELTVAFRNAAKDGMTPNIETLIQLSAEYNAIQDPAERLNFVMDAFGPRGAAMARILELDAEQIRAMASEADAAGLILDEAMVAKSEDARMALDALGDASLGLKVAFTDLIGTGFSGFIEGAAGLIRAATGVLTAENRLQEAYEQGIITEQELIDIRREAGGAGVSLADAEALLAEAVGRTNAEENNRLYLLPQVSEETAAATERVAGYTGAAFAAADAQYNWNESMGASEPVITAVESAISELTGSFNESSETASLLSQGLDLITSSMVEQQRIALALEIATSDLSAQEIEARLNALDRLAAIESLNAALEAGTIDQYDWIAAMADGEVTQEEVNALLGQTEDALGAIPPAAASVEGAVSDAASSMGASGLAMAASMEPAAGETQRILSNLRQIDGMAVSATIDITATGSGTAGEVNLYMAQGGAFTVPPGYPDDSFIVGLTSGERVVVDNSQDNYNLTINSNAQTEQVAQSYQMMRSLAGG